jgi:pyruvate dehydrogenase E1 component
MASFIAAGTAYATHGVPMIPMYIYYSMFGLQRVGDQVWLAGDIRAKGFLIGGTAGRTTLSGEGLQHQDGHSHLFAYAIPTLKAYDPAYAYELAVIIQDGIKRMYTDGEEIFYYLTVMNENYAMPPMPEGEGVKEGIIRGMYRFRAAEGDYKVKAQVFGSGAILNEAVLAQGMLHKYGVGADVWSVTSYQQLYRDAIDAERWNLLHPGEEPKVPFITQQLQGTGDVVVASSDYVKALPESIAQYVPYPMACLGTDGFGRSDGRKALRDFFEVDARYITLATLTELAKAKKIKWDVVQTAMKDLGIDPEKLNPHTS